MKHMQWIVLAVVALLGLGAPAHAQAYQSTREFVPTFEAPEGAQGVFIDTFLLSSFVSRHDFSIVVSGLEAGSYDLDFETSNGPHSFTFNVGGTTNTVFERTGVSINTVGALITISKDDVILMRTLGSGPLDLATDGAGLFEKSKGKGKLVGATKAKAKVKLVTTNKVKPENLYTAAFLQFSFKKLEPLTSYEIIANNWPIATFVSDEKGKAEVIFSNEPIATDKILNFDPNGVNYEIRLNGGVSSIMSGVVTGPPIGGGLVPVDGLNYLMAVTGIDNDVTGRANMRGASPSAITELEINVEKLAEGTYDVMVDEAVIGTLITDSNGDGQAIFSTTPTGTEQDLAVPIANKLIRIVNDDNHIVLGRTLFVID